MKVFDPSSGSGSFLVQAYRLLIEKTFPGTGPKPKPRELRALLEESIFGCDVDGDACQVTQLSLLLTLLDYVEPPDLTGPMHSFKLPTLCETKDPQKLSAGHTPNILKHNFFGVEFKLAAAVARKQEASVDWRKQGFDWIVGNPPWKTIRPKNLGKNDAPVWQWMQSHEKSKPVGDNEAAQAFAWEAPRYLKTDGECALLIPAMGLFEEPSENFRRSFFTTYQAHEVANFANLSEVLFDGRARVPAAAISYRHLPEDKAINPDGAITVPSNDVPSAKTGLPRKGKRRPKIDIRIVCKHQIPSRGYCIEAKRLYRSDSVSEYMDEEGIGAFICGDYAMNDDLGGMIGYVQTGAVNHWVDKIEAKLKTCPNLIHYADKATWRPTQLQNGPETCFTSNHRRESGREIAIFHVMFFFRAT